MAGTHPGLGGRDLDRLLVRHGEMSRIRAFEEALAEGHASGELPGLLHLSTGAEAVAVGVNACLREPDRIYSSHRPHGHFLAAGVDPRSILAELAGRESGLCRGRGGTMHLTSERVVTATGIVGGTLPLAVGHAVAQRDGAVVVVFFGDGAVQSGTFSESVNLAALWRVPLLLVCENNGWAEFSTREEHTTVGDVARYGELYGILARSVDGTDVAAVEAAAAELLEPMRAGGGPALLECHIARLRSHYEGDWREHSAEGDPLPALEQRLTAGGADGEALAEVRERDLLAARELLATVLAEEPTAEPAADRELVFRRSLP